MIRVVLPYHLRMLAKITGELQLEIIGPVTQRSVVDEIENRYPMLKGTIRDQETKLRRPMLRFFACEQDFSNESPDSLYPAAIADGTEPLLIVGAIAGG